MNSKGRKPARKRVEGPFGKNLKQILEERGMSIRAAAEICGLQPSVIHDWVTGSQCNNPMALAKLCKAIKCNFEWLLTGTMSDIAAKDLSLTELFHIQDEPAFSGIFMIEAKRLKRKGE